jgi:hypothetical protein
VKKKGSCQGGLILLAAVALFLVAMCSAGCAIAPHSVRAELEHVSHPLAGYPFGPADEEDALSQLNVLLKWHQQRGWYTEAGCGYKLMDEGMHGPRLTFTARIGKEFRLGD